MDRKEIDRIFFRDGYRLAHHHLGRRIAPEVFIAAVDQLFREVDRLLLSFLERSAAEKNPAACRRGCSWCCHQEVFASTHELLFLSRYVRDRFEKPVRDDLLRRARGKIRDTLRENIAGRIGSGSPCVFLENGICRVYEARPMACRIYLSPSENDCRDTFADPSEEAIFPHLFAFPLQAGRMMNEGFTAFLRQNNLQVEEYKIEQGYASLITGNITIESWIGLSFTAH